jgi:hypothetical protein
VTDCPGYILVSGTRERGGPLPADVPAMLAIIEEVLK